MDKKNEIGKRAGMNSIINWIEYIEITSGKIFCEMFSQK